MRVLIFGATGMLGHKLYQQLSLSFDIYGTVRGQASDLHFYELYDSNKIIGNIDAGDIESVRRALDTAIPDVVVNAIGLVKQLDAVSDPELARAINSDFPQMLARLTRERGSKLIAISTDCVFGGAEGNYTESDIPDATDPYGTSKRAGEPEGPNVLTLRTSIIGREIRNRHGLVEWFLSNAGQAVKGYVNAIFSGLTTLAIGRLVSDLVAYHSALTGLYHVSADPISKYDLLVALNEAFATGTHIEPSDELAIDRSLDSSRFRAATGWKPQTWAEMIRDMAADPTPYDAWRHRPGDQ
jgi:dTDP-4-dehydrorhamnose reductase